MVRTRQLLALQSCLTASTDHRRLTVSISTRHRTEHPHTSFQGRGEIINKECRRPRAAQQCIRDSSWRFPEKVREAGARSKVGNGLSCWKGLPGGAGGGGGAGWGYRPLRKRMELVRKTAVPERALGIERYPLRGHPDVHSLRSSEVKAISKQWPT